MEGEFGLAVVLEDSQSTPALEGTIVLELPHAHLHQSVVLQQTAQTLDPTNLLLAPLTQLNCVGCVLAAVVKQRPKEGEKFAIKGDGEGVCPCELRQFMVDLLDDMDVSSLQENQVLPLVLSTVIAQCALGDCILAALVELLPAGQTEPVVPAVGQLFPQLEQVLEHYQPQSPSFTPSQLE